MPSVKKTRPVPTRSNPSVKKIKPIPKYGNENYWRLLNEESDQKPTKVDINGKIQWVFKGYVYEIAGNYSDQQIHFLILEHVDFDKSRQLNDKFNNEPVEINIDGSLQWVFNGYIYEVEGSYMRSEVRQLILEDFEKERYSKKLNAKLNQTENVISTFGRPRIPESVRIEVWRRDGGKCARCGSREKLEYDHIVPISKGGSNTARNIELLCEKCNRSKSNNVV